MSDLNVNAADYSPNSAIPDTVLDTDDSLSEIVKLAGIGNQAQLSAYTGYSSVPKTRESNVSHTANEKIQYQKEHDIQPGTPEWFKLWFSLPYLTNEKPMGD